MSQGHCVMAATPQVEVEGGGGRAEWRWSSATDLSVPPGEGAVVAGRRSSARLRSRTRRGGGGAWPGRGGGSMWSGAAAAHGRGASAQSRLRRLPSSHACGGGRLEQEEKKRQEMSGGEMGIRWTHVDTCRATKVEVATRGSSA
jgi:hypothetical protein